MGAKVVWTIIFFWFISLIILFFAVATKCEEVKFQWDYPSDEIVDGFRIYERIEGDAYTVPVAETNGEARNATIELSGVEGELTKYEFVARAFRGDNESVDSNTVSCTIDKRIIPPATNLTIIVIGVPVQ